MTGILLTIIVFLIYELIEMRINKKHYNQIYGMKRNTERMYKNIQAKYNNGEYCPQKKIKIL